MPVHLQREIEKSKKMILSLSGQVEEMLRQAVRAVAERDAALARRVIDADDAIDRAEVEIEEEILKVLALHQPVAIDLRFLVVTLKINNDLERIGDLAVNIAERALYLDGQPPQAIPFDFPGIAEKTQWMLRNSIDALVNADAALARRVSAMDDEVDAINRQMYDQVKATLRAHPEAVDALIALLSVSRSLERVADHATYIAEDVVYLHEGVIVRHTPKPAGADSSSARP